MEPTTHIDHVADANGNKCFFNWFGSKDAAQNALDSLENCENCINCSDCSRCSNCSDCSDCSGCSRCSGCSDCSDCSDCSRCSNCSDCSDCSNCSDCSDCSDCSRCSGLTNVKKSVHPSSKIPVIENIHTKVLEAVSVDGALDMGAWHRSEAVNEEGAYCGTTHCRAGWVVALAGREGRALELYHNTPLAAQLIYNASSPHKVSPPRFYEDNKMAMADMKRMAELEATSQ